MISVILPTYNERESIVALINEIAEILEKENIALEIIIVDDNSPDGTSDVVKTAFKDDSRIKLHVRTDERGLASAIHSGIEKSQGEIIVIMDTDFNHDPKMIPLLIYVTKYFDIAIGSRYVAGGGMDTSKLRYYTSLFYNLFVRFVLNMHTKDNLSGFLGIRRDVVKNITFKSIFYGYGDYCIRFLYFAKQKKMKMLEIPVVYNVRRGGESKTNFIKHLLQYTTTVLRLRFKGIQ